MELETLVDGWEFLEAPRADEAGNLWFSDVTKGGLHKRHSDGRIESFLRGRTWIGGIALNEGGGIVCSGKDGLILFDERSGTSRQLRTALDGLPIGAINDFCPTSDGGVVAGLIDAESVGAGRPPQSRPLIRLDPNGRVTRLWDGIGISNGIGFSPDGRRLYQSESYKTVWVYDVGADGALHDRRVFADIQDADGMAVDAEGGVWIARFDSWEVARFLPDGRRAGGLKVPIKEVQSVSFGGSDLRDLYIATGSDFKNPTNLVVRTGCVFKARSDVPGLALPKTRF
ncbi:MAG TPA: SMP-30/gluconolactonase/LRE family protein [Alphaproteobacteria bacterium]|nr:SMP-30/gluconolactonase/LRE family protein [Alphaproteobacteria bacterium]